MSRLYEHVARLSVDLRRVEPTVRRRFEIPAEMTLADLHAVLQIAFQWDGDHLHKFDAGDRQFGPPEVREPRFGPPVQPEEGIKLVTLWRRGVTKLRYTYDFGDDWIHNIRILRMREAAPDGAPPTLLFAKGASPQEDCGGPIGYMDMVDILADPAHPAHAEYAEMYPDGLDPHTPETEEIERGFAALRRAWRPRGRRSKSGGG